MLRTLIFFALVATAAPAAADVTARYRLEDGRVLVFEVNERGIVRIGSEGANGYLQLDGIEIFAVSRVGSFTEVEPMSDSLAATEAAVERMYPRPQAPAAADGDAQGWVAADPATVEGRAGIAYRLADAPPPEVADIVLSEDPQLAPLGRAWSRSLDIMPILVDTTWTSGDRDTRQLGELMATRAPLQYGPARLISVSFDRIDPARFVMPVPFTREDALDRIWEQRRRGAAPEGE